MFCVALVLRKYGTVRGHDGESMLLIARFQFVSRRDFGNEETLGSSKSIG